MIVLLLLIPAEQVACVDLFFHIVKKRIITISNNMKSYKKASVESDCDGCDIVRKSLEYRNTGWLEIGKLNIAYFLCVYKI